LPMRELTFCSVGAMLTDFSSRVRHHFCCAGGGDTHPFGPPSLIFHASFFFFFFFLVTLLLHSSSSQSLTLCHWHYRYHYHRPFHPREVSWIWTRQDRMTFPKTGQGEGECSRQGTRGFKVVQGVYSSY